MPSVIPESSIVEAQLASLDDTDCYASVWDDILSRGKVVQNNNASLWGGRGKGGRGLSRRTVQPYDIVVEDVRLQYLLGDTCLDGATLKLLQGHKYALCGKNGCGKSTLLQRMHAQKIPGWSVQWSSLYLPPELPCEYISLSPMEVMAKYQAELSRHNRAATEARIDEVQAKLDELDMENEPEVMECLCEELSELEDQLDADQQSSTMEQSARTILNEMECDDSLSSCRDMSPGQQKRLLLSVAALLGSQTNLLLLDEPTAHLDVFGLIQLRRLLEIYPATVVMISHDVDFLNDVATDIIEMQDQKLWYFPGNYDNYRIVKEQQGIHELRQSAKLEKKRGNLLNTLQHIKEQPVPKRGGTKKKAKAVASQRKKLERHDHIEKATRSSTPATSSIIPSRRGLTAQQRLKLVELMKSIPDKAVQFNFPQTKSTWGEPMITALEIGFGYGEELTKKQESSPEQDSPGEGFQIVKKEGYLFDCVDLCIDEGSRHCICGPSASGKSTLLGILAKRRAPLEGTIYHASGVRVGYFDASKIQETIASMADTRRTSALDYLFSRYPEKMEQDLRGHLTAFGLSPTTQAKTPILFLSSGEKCRFLLAAIMFDDPPVLCLDDPTLHLDAQSVQALVYGLRQWNGTIVLVSSDANFLRSLEDVKCSVLLPEEGKLRRVEGGMDAYLKSFQ
jgi:ATP-binding cassette subfamily F protein 3